MKKIMILTALNALLFAGSMSSEAVVPQLINYQGRIVSNGTNFNGTGQFKFALLNGAGTQAYWNNNNSNGTNEPTAAVAIPVVNGLYAVLLGDTTLSNMTAIPLTVFANADVRLRVWFNNGTNGSQLLSPDQRIAAVGYALMAANVPDGAISSAKLANNAVTAASLANDSITSAKLANNSITAGKLTDGTVTSSKLADGVVTAAKVAQGLLATLSSNITNIGFGNCSNCARVNVFGTESNCHPAITLDGCESKISAFVQENGAEVAVISATSSGGQITLRDEQMRATIRATSSGLGGGSLTVLNDLQDTTIWLDGGFGSSGNGSIRVGQPGGSRVVVAGKGISQGGTIVMYNEDGEPTINFGAGNRTTTGRITTPILEITGGADLSENFEINSSGAELPGMIVCIDPQNPGQLLPSSRAYDRTVAGIVSGAGGVNPGMLMGQRGTKADGKHPVALTGRVYCMVDADEGVIQPGDLITTSNTPGHGMRVSDTTRAHGAIIGKAMTPLASGKGLVLVLVSLQ